MSRLTIAAAILDAAQRWKQQCLVEGRSLFCGERLWTSEYFGELQTYFVDRPDTGSGTFDDKLRRQLEPTTPQAKRLWAEMSWVYFLISDHLRGTTKRDKIRAVWESSAEALPIDHPALGDVLEKGMVNPGPAYSRNPWREYYFIIRMMLDWCARTAKERTSLLADPWRFAEWVDGQSDARRRQFRHVLLFLLFPDTFESIATRTHKVNIVEALRDNTSEPADIDGMEPIELDKELLQVRQRLQDKYDSGDVNFYESPFEELWRSGRQPSRVVDREERDDDEAWYRDRFGSIDVWVIGAGPGARLWPEFLEAGFVAIGWDDLGDLAAC